MLDKRSQFAGFAGVQLYPVDDLLALGFSHQEGGKQEIKCDVDHFLQANTIDDTVQIACSVGKQCACRTRGVEQRVQERNGPDTSAAQIDHAEINTAAKGGQRLDQGTPERDTMEHIGYMHGTEHGAGTQYGDPKTLFAVGVLAGDGIYDHAPLQDLLPEANADEHQNAQ